MSTVAVFDIGDVVTVLEEAGTWRIAYKSECRGKTLFDVSRTNGEPASRFSKLIYLQVSADDLTHAGADS